MPEINAGDTAWVLTSTALVMLMTPGLALFYGGLVRRKNVLSTIMHSFFILGLVSVTWVLWGYTLAFGPDTGLGLIGGLDWLALEGVTGAPSDVYATTIPHLAFMAFQMMFAIITPALISGAFAERKRFKAFVLFAVAWSTLRLRADRALGLVARRLAVRPRRARLRRRHRRPPLERHRRAGRRPLHRPPHRPGRAGHRAARRADDRPRRRASCGSAGSASTPARRSARTASPPTHSSPPTRPRPWPPSPGSPSAGCTRARRRCSAPRSAPSPAWSPSRRPPGT